MKRTYVPLLVAACSVAWIAGASVAQTYPNRALRVVVPFPPAGAADMLTRFVGADLTRSWGQQVIVDNRPGAGGNIGAEAVARAAPDGYTLLMAPITTYAVGMAAYQKLSWHLEKDLASVAIVANVPHILVAHPSLPVKNVRDVIALARARPNEINFASQGNGTLSHVEQEMLKQMGGFTATHVPYKGSGPGLADLIPGYVQLFFDSIPSSAPHVKSGKLRAIGVASSKRSPALPEVPTISEQLKGFEADSLFGFMVPAGTPRDVIVRFNAEVQKALGNAELRERVTAQGGLLHGGSPEDMAKLVRTDIEKWGKVVRTAGVRIE